MTDSAATAAEPRMLQCMEVWGGNQAVQNRVALPGLDAWVWSRPFRGAPHGAPAASAHDAAGAESAGAEPAGGDIHYVSSCATGRIIRVLVADVSGHGAEVAAVARQLRELMRRFVNHLDQGAFLRSLNREFAAIATRGRFATAIVTTYWSPTGALEVCNAGHPRPILYRGRDASWGWVEAEHRAPGVANVPLGILDRARYDTGRLMLGRDDLLLLYTDALIEARAANGEMLGEDGLLEMVRGLPADPDLLLPALDRALAAYRGGDVADDDETVLLVRPNAFAPRLTLGERAASMTRMLGLLARSLRPGAPPMPWPDLNLANVGGYLVPGIGRRARRFDSARG